jgi:hypothetical protein
MQITESLATALGNLQSKDQDLVLWADAICINQNDPIEKTSQVQLMRDIYRTAHRVIIWLGPSTAETYYTMREMRRLGDQLIETGFWNLSAEDILHWEVQDDDTSSSISTKRAILSMESEHWSQMRKDEFPFWWIMSDLGKRDWFYVSIQSTVSCVRYAYCYREFGAFKSAPMRELPLFVAAKTSLILLGRCTYAHLLLSSFD